MCTDLDYTGKLLNISSSYKIFSVFSENELKWPPVVALRSPPLYAINDKFIFTLQYDPFHPIFKAK